jgi:hypothetical protein
MFFNKKQRNKETDSLINEYKNIQGSIDFLENEVSNYIIKSLKEDVAQYINNLKSGSTAHKNVYWYIEKELEQMSLY